MDCKPCGKINFRKLFRLESNAGLTLGSSRCTVARDVLKCLLAGSLANQHHSTDAFANIQKLFQLCSIIKCWEQTDEACKMGFLAFGCTVVTAACSVAEERFWEIFLFRIVNDTGILSSYRTGNNVIILISSCPVVLTSTGVYQVVIT